MRIPSISKLKRAFSPFGRALFDEMKDNIPYSTNCERSIKRNLKKSFHIEVRTKQVMQFALENFQNVHHSMTSGNF